MQVLWRKLNSGMWFLTVLGRKNTRFFARSSLGIKEFLFRMAQTIISMFALRTRAAHLLLDCPPDTLRCALTASQLSLGGTQNKERHPSDASPYYIRMCMRGITKQYPRRKWLVTTRKTRFAESNRTSSSPQGLKILGDPKKKRTVK